MNTQFITYTLKNALEDECLDLAKQKNGLNYYLKKIVIKSVEYLFNYFAIINL